MLKFILWFLVITGSIDILYILIMLRHNRLKENNKNGGGIS